MTRDDDFIAPNLDELIRRGDAMDAVETEENLMGAMDSLWDGTFRRTKRAAVRVIAGVPAAPHEMTAREFFEKTKRRAQEEKRRVELIFEPVDQTLGDFNGRIADAEQWAKEHPEKKRKTYAEDFKEKYPNHLHNCGMPIVCRNEVYGYGGRCTVGEAVKRGGCRSCWNEEMPEEEEDEADS